ncbi:MAG: hypothetical protein P8N02_11150 [Actinomycetota bacterium]|nr:hypothetical protein [Actinomycetota bacterium]
MIGDYHADAPSVGALAGTADVGKLLLTHMTPTPHTPDEEQAYIDEMRRGGYADEIVIGHDLTTVDF